MVHWSLAIPRWRKLKFCPLLCDVDGVSTSEVVLSEASPTQLFSSSKTTNGLPLGSSQPAPPTHQNPPRSRSGAAGRLCAKAAGAKKRKSDFSFLFLPRSDNTSAARLAINCPLQHPTNRLTHRHDYCDGDSGVSPPSRLARDRIRQPGARTLRRTSKSRIALGSASEQRSNSLEFLREAAGLAQMSEELDARCVTTRSNGRPVH